MAKLTFSTLLACTLQMGFNPAFASSGSISHEFSIQTRDLCDAPPPENFHVSDLASDFVTLNWEPALANATQTLEVSIQENGNWIQLFENYNVPGNSYLLGNLESGFYQAIISTNCASGETSTYSTKIEFEIKIIDLTIAGRMPLAPVAVEDCEKIDYKNHEWVGFKVTEIATGEANFFEFQENTEGEYPQIKRVFYDGPIMAVDQFGLYPTEFDPKLNTPTPFRLDDLNNGDLINIGFVICDVSDFLTLCKDDNNQVLEWKSEYSFQAMTAEEIIDGSYPNNISSEKAPKVYTAMLKVSVQNPIEENLNICFPEITIYDDITTTNINLFNTDNQNVFTFSFHLNIPSISLPVNNLLPGIYFLQIKTGTGIQTFKVVKSI